jgi:hypothetical protein
MQKKKKALSNGVLEGIAQQKLRHYTPTLRRTLVRRRQQGFSNKGGLIRLYSLM